MIATALVIAITLLLFLIISFTLYERYKYHLKIKDVSQLLQAAAHNLVREMENNPTFTAKRYRHGIKQDYEELVINSLTRIQPKTPSIAIGALPAPITKLPGALETIQDNKTFAKDFWFVAQGLRNGLQVFIYLFILENPKAAHLKMIEHMKRQRNEFENKSTMRSLNLSELKMVLGLPTEWPKGELPEQLERKQLSVMRVWLIHRAVKHHRQDILKGLVYKPYTFDGNDDQPEFFGEDVILVGFREYIR